jgi:hypothetical protein
MLQQYAGLTGNLSHWIIGDPVGVEALSSG